jgi:hypothetical protein
MDLPHTYCEESYANAADPTFGGGGKKFSAFGSASASMYSLTSSAAEQRTAPQTATEKRTFERIFCIYKTPHFVFAKNIIKKNFQQTAENFDVLICSPAWGAIGSFFTSPQ